ncbi:MAG: hypothetical protein H0X03_05590 [Nitrosopumilus sp.]|nr:hypothetical protein [Nitrosopumilus sp.]
MSEREDKKKTFKDNLCDLIFDIDENIRFVGIVNKDSEVIGGGFKKGIEPLLDVNEEQDMYLQSLSNMTFFQSFSKKFGLVDYIITKQKKITIMTFPYESEILCLSISSGIDIDMARDETIKILLKYTNK